MLKKIIFIVILALFVVFQVSTSHAQLRRDYDYYSGKILKVDTESQSIVFLNSRTSSEMNLTVEDGWEYAKEGERVVLSVQKGTDIVKMLKPARK